jgi:hypothetical protein
MRRLLLVVFALAGLPLGRPAVAQALAPLVTAEGNVACIQGMTGIGHPSRWEAVRDSEASYGWALTETREDATDLHFPICICQGVAARDLSATLRFNPLSGSRAQTAGLVLRAQSANDYYVVAANALDGSVRLFRMFGGRRAQLAASDGAIAVKQWHELKVTLVEDRFEVWLDQALQFKTSDKNLQRSGAIGVWTQADSLVRFGALVIGPPS